VYLLVNGRKALGFLKVGRKRLFITAPSTGGHEFADVQETFREIEPLCVLDFYVHERCQRSGHGKRLFDTMLAREEAAAPGMAYDRPSDKLLLFLQKHYGLCQYSPQNNNFVVFNDYFEQDLQKCGLPHQPSRQSATTRLSGSRQMMGEEQRRCGDEQTSLRREPMAIDVQRNVSGQTSSAKLLTASQRAAVAQQEGVAAGFAKRGGDLFNRSMPNTVARHTSGTALF
jgi:alpha-tubulin N-acetyltransferase 1